MEILQDYPLQTDSLMYDIETDAFYEDISPYATSMFGTSNYPKDHWSGIQPDEEKGDRYDKG